MKGFLIISVLTALVFIGLTLVTAKIEVPFDGNDTYGFPLIFYKIYGGKRTFYPPNEFSVLTLVLDVFFVFLVVLIGRTVFVRLKAIF